MAKQGVRAARAATVDLGGKAFEIRALPMGASRKWRKKYAEPLQAVIGVLRNAGDLQLTTTDEAGEEKMNAGAILGLVQQVGSLLINSMDWIWDAVLEYSPALANEEAFIEENAYNDEALEVLWEILKLEYPFGILDRLSPGAATTGKRSRSRRRNGG